MGMGSCFDEKQKKKRKTNLHPQCVYDSIAWIIKSDIAFVRATRT